MGEVDEDILNDSRKGLTVSFAVVIAIVNLILLARLRKPGQNLFKRPFRYVLFWLAVGDILLLFNLIPRAIFYFEPSNYVEDLSCRTKILSLIYMNFMQFVYFTGIIVLGVELLSRSNSEAETKLMKSFLFAAFPYCLALIVVLPLYLVDMDWDHCIPDFPKRLKAILWTIHIVPVSAALMFSILVVSVRTRTVSTLDRSRQLDNPLTPETPLSPAPQPQYLAPTAPSLYPEIPAQEASFAHPPPYTLHDPNSGPAVHMNAPQGYTYPYQGQPYPYQGQPYTPQPSEPIRNQSYMQASARQDTCDTENNWQLEMRRDKASLLSVAVVTFILVMPSFIYSAIYIYEPKTDTLEGVAKVITEEVLEWLPYLRPVLTAILWSCTQ